tara:strand:- start:593 stop:1012 length:420 start_codon:yes stop_codon:yes gene_type:complete
MAGQIFVYGSLMKGFFNHEKYLKHRLIKVEKAKTRGILYHLANKGYPGMIRGDGQVYGEIITFIDEVDCIAEMDKLEGFKGTIDPENPYNRLPAEVINLETNTTHILDLYAYNPQALCNRKDQRILLENGDWSNYMKLG